KVVILGGGVSGMNAARMAMGMSADVTVVDKSLERLNELDTIFDSRLNTVYSTVDAIEAHCLDADLVIGCVLIPGAAAPKLVTRDMIAAMEAGTVLVDVAIDQGGCFETSKATTHDNPTFMVDDVVHYCVANMPGAVARTSTQALNNATLPFTLALANKGWKRALAENEHLMEGLNVAHGKITYAAVANAHGLDSIRPQEAIGI
ncbi:MAG: alanine dehydrogenase, partial [Pseudomonadota bacterium]